MTRRASSACGRRRSRRRVATRPASEEGARPLHTERRELLTCDHRRAVRSAQRPAGSRVGATFEGVSRGHRWACGWSCVVSALRSTRIGNGLDTCTRGGLGRAQRPARQGRPVGPPTRRPTACGRRTIARRDRGYPGDSASPPRWRVGDVIRLPGRRAAIRAGRRARRNRATRRLSTHRTRCSRPSTRRWVPDSTSFVRGARAPPALRER